MSAPSARASTPRTVLVVSAQVTDLVARRPPGRPAGPARLRPGLRRWRPHRIQFGYPAHLVARREIMDRSPFRHDAQGAVERRRNTPDEQRSEIYDKICDKGAGRNNQLHSLEHSHFEIIANRDGVDHS